MPAPERDGSPGLSLFQTGWGRLRPFRLRWTLRLAEILNGFPGPPRFETTETGWWESRRYTFV
jgi:hypothetical protein